MSLKLPTYSEAMTIQIYDNPDISDPLNLILGIRVTHRGKQLCTTIPYEWRKGIKDNLENALEAALPLMIATLDPSELSTEPQPQLATP